LIDSASASLIRGDLQSARAAYSQAMRTNPRDTRGLVGQALAAYFQGDTGSAIQQLELAYSQNNTYFTATNLAALHLTRNPTRSSRVLYDYLRTTDRLSEEAFDHFTLALWRAQAAGKDSTAFWQMVQYHEVYERRLRVARGGDERRWGREWKPSELVEEQMQRLSAARARVFESRQALSMMTNLRRRAGKSLDSGGVQQQQQAMSSFMSLHSEVTKAQQNLAAAKADFQAAMPWMGFEIPIVVP
jgi:tetratricopeptide (TPR) repeat protein